MGSARRVENKAAKPDDQAELPAKGRIFCNISMGFDALSNQRIITPMGRIREKKVTRQQNAIAKNFHFPKERIFNCFVCPVPLV